MPPKKPKAYFSHFRALIGLSVLGIVFFGYMHPHTYTIIPSSEKDFDRDSIAILKALDWLGGFLSICIGVIAHWLHSRLDAQNAGASNDKHSES